MTYSKCIHDTIANGKCIHGAMANVQLINDTMAYGKYLNDNMGTTGASIQDERKKKINVAKA